MNLFQSTRLQRAIRGIMAAGALFSITTAAKAQQFFTYNQYMNNLTPINHAYSLVDKNGNITGLFRKQWVGVEGSPQTFIFNGYAPLENIGAAIGGTVLNDKFAAENLTEINGFFAKGVQLGRNNYLGVSLNAGYRRYTTNYAERNAGDPVFANDVRQNKANIGFGVMYYTSNAYLGVSVPELTITSLGDAGVQQNAYFRNHYYFSGAYLLNTAEDFKVKPAFLATYTRGVPFVADFSTTMYIKNTLGIGANYRTNNEMSGIISVMTDQFRLGYSYQFGTSSANIGRFNNATHEVTLSYRFGKHLNEHGLL
ncbi:PorP/SprF family type IX secretion system membrane protein [Mucilaginibacter sp. RS28]|uniref:PorP/SprF family type IX secretion system membrane protein n=1 Tax=Mucilaginibacter straminoryzae TaxID=2932774 RepID=A0A9X1X475_9SPHI|nr:PorP/SprF family type IX secretion system membrane protein [Mucilaginibacter straminoryzae]MCJ8210653.1 PorP/SprF family type IX secretion system membrane protein [Mucilaginibacter straminoryzae]